MAGGRFSRLGGRRGGFKRLNEDLALGPITESRRRTCARRSRRTRLIMGEGPPVASRSRYEGRVPGHRHQGLGIRPQQAGSRPSPDSTPPRCAKGCAGWRGDRRRDGLIGPPDMCPIRLARRGRGFPSFETGLQRSGRQRSELDFIPTITTVIDDDEARAPRCGRERTIAFYSTVRTYKPLWEMPRAFGRTQPRRAGEAFRKGDLAAVPEQIPDEDGRGLHRRRFRWTRCAARVRRGRGARVDGVFLTPAHLLSSRRSRSASIRARIIEFLRAGPLPSRPARRRRP